MDDAKSMLFIERSDFFFSQAPILIKCLKEHSNFHHLVPEIIAKLMRGDFNLTDLEMDIIAKCCNEHASTFSKNSKNRSLYYLLFTLCNSIREQD